MTEFSHIVAELGLTLAITDESFFGAATVTPEMCVPGTNALRTSIIAVWADVVTGAVAGRFISPQIPLTLDLEVQVHRPTFTGTRLVCEGLLVKAGRSIVVTHGRFRDEATGELHAETVASFMTAPGSHQIGREGSPMIAVDAVPLAVPFAQRCGSRTIEPGVVEVPRRPDGLNPGGAIQGGIVAFAAEQAAASLHHEPVLLVSLNVRYLRPFMVGPARCVATGTGEVSVVHLTDAGTGKIGAIATTRARRLS